MAQVQGGSSSCQLGQLASTTGVPRTCQALVTVCAQVTRALEAQHYAAGGIKRRGSSRRVGRSIDGTGPCRAWAEYITFVRTLIPKQLAAHTTGVHARRQTIKHETGVKRPENCVKKPEVQNMRVQGD